MKKLLLLCSVLLIMFGAKAQFPGMGNAAPKVTGRISATIIDSLTKLPVDYASVSLIRVKDNKTINGALTDDKGKIVLQNIAPDEYKLAVGFIGYTSKSVIVKTTLQKPDFNLGNVILAPSSNTLKEITVEGKKSMIENKIDRLVYNAEADATNAGGDATDVMRKVPMLSVDINGNVQLRGSAVRVLINGKPSGTMANSVADALKMIPADQIKSVEVITSPSAKYDAEGSGGIINIITKKSNAQGVSGSVNTSVGTRQNTGAFNLTAKTGRLSMNTALGTMLAYPQNTRVIFLNKTTSNTGQVSTVNQDGISEWSREMFNGSLGLDYDFNAYNNISTNAKYNRFYNGGPGSSNYGINGVSAKNVSASDMSNDNVDWNIDYKRTSKRAGEEFSVAGQLTTGSNSNDFSNTLSMLSLPDVITASHNIGKNIEYTAQTDYVYPFSKAVIFEVGAKGIFRNIKSQYDNNSAQDFDYNQNVGAGYSTISFNLSKKLQFKGGLRAEYTDVNINEDNYKKDYFNLFPSAIISHTLKANTTLKLSYNRRVQRPSLSYLNPFRNESNQFSVFQGNPLLDPELSDNVELGYSTYIKGSIINASVFYRRTKGIIENANMLDPTDPSKILTTYINVGRSESYGMNVFGSYNPKPKWTLMSSVGLNTYQVSNAVSNLNTDTYLNYNLFFRSANSFKKGWNMELFGVVNSPRRTFQGKTDAMFFYGGAVKKEILKKKGTIGLNVLNPFNKNLNIKMVNESANSYQLQNIFYPLRSVGVNFSYNFGQLKFTEKKKIKNDDIKQDQQQQGGGGQVGGMGK